MHVPASAGDGYDRLIARNPEPTRETTGPAVRDLRAVISQLLCGNILLKNDLGGKAEGSARSKSGNRRRIEQLLDEYSSSCSHHADVPNRIDA